MDYRHALTAVALAWGLAGCASYSSGYQSDIVYRDGSYYSPVDAGYGDYYYAPEPRDDYYYNYYGQDFFYGAPLYGFGAYCSVRYRHCPPFGYSRFPDNGWYAPFGGGFGYGYYPAPYHGGYRPRSHDRDRHRDRDQERIAPRRPSIGDARPPTSTPVRRQAQPRRSYPRPEPQQPRSDPAGSSERSDDDRRQSRRDGDRT